jgi:hypothetical protein
MPNELLFCGKCGKPLRGHYLACDRTMKEYCEDCFEKTPCGKGKHGEGCPTQIFEDSDHAE